MGVALWEPRQTLHLPLGERLKQALYRILEQDSISTPRRAHIAHAKAKSAVKASPAKKAPKGRTQPSVAKPKAARDGSKTAEILDLLKRPDGATSKELRKATGWLPHWVRGFLSGTVRKKMHLPSTPSAT